MLWFSVLDAL